MSTYDDNKVLIENAHDGFAHMLAERARRRAERPAIEEAGEAALRRLFTVAMGDSGQCRYIAAFLLGLYNGSRFPFDLTDFRCLDDALFDDCIAVLRMDASPQREVHTYFPNGGAAFEELASDWKLTDYRVLRLTVEAIAGTLTGLFEEVATP